MSFAKGPYRRYRYGERSARNLASRDQLGHRPDSGERVRLIVELLKEGDFSVREDLAELIEADDSDTRLYAIQVFAHVCSHRSSSLFKRALDAIEDVEELKTAILLVGESLSPAVIPMLLELATDLDTPDSTDYINDAVNTILSFKDPVDTLEAQQAVQEALSHWNETEYLFRGRSVFVGDVSKEVLTNASAATQSLHRKLEMFIEPELLSNFSGLACPVSYGTSMDSKTFGELLDYVSKLARMEWKRGAKYFYGHEVPA